MTLRLAEIAPGDILIEPKPCGVDVVLPCYNEALAIAAVVKPFQKILPDATVYVFDNASTDATVAEALGVGAIPIADYMRTGLVPHFPTAILSAGIMGMACLSMVSGIILDSVSRGRREMRRLFYLLQGEPPPGLEPGANG
jgi:hypothetical protein